MITLYRNGAGNLRTPLARINWRAGLTPWPRVTHNLRASRATEQSAEYPAHVAAAWWGHGTLVAHQHYWQVTETDFDRDSQDGAESSAAGARFESQ